MREARPARRPDDADRVPRGLVLSGRVPARAAAGHAGVAARRARASRSSTWRRPRSTRTSPTSSTAARRTRTRARSASLVDSPRDVPTYDHKPEMSAREAADAFVERWAARRPRLRDHQLREPRHGRAHGLDPGGGRRRARRSTSASGRSSRPSTRSGGACIVTADHGNADDMLEPDGSPNTAHSLNPVPLVVTADVAALRDGGILADVAPTVLDLMGIEPPPAMTGTSLLLKRAGALHDRRPRRVSPRGRSSYGARRRAARRRSCRSPRPRPSSRCRPTRWPELGYEMVLGNTFHLFIQPGPRARRADGRPARVHGLATARSSPTRAASRCSRWGTGRSPRRSSGARPSAGRPRTAACSRSRRRACAFAPTSTAASGSWGPRPRWRSRPRSAPTSRSRSTSARPSTSRATTPPARPSAPTAGSTAASPGTSATRPSGSSSSASCRAASTRTCAASRPSG